LKCPKCGNEVYPDQFVCGYCGAPNMQRKSANAGNTSIYNLDSAGKLHEESQQAGNLQAGKYHAENAGGKGSSLNQENAGRKGSSLNQENSGGNDFSLNQENSAASGSSAKQKNLGNKLEFGAISREGSDDAETGGEKMEVSELQVSSDSDAQPKKKRKIKIILIMLLFSVLLVVGIGIVIWRVRSNHKETPYEKLIKTYLKAYEDMDAEALCATLAPKITDKRIEKKGGITYAEMTAETFQSMKESGDRVRYDVTVKETGKLSDDVIERYAKKISEEYGNVTLSDFRRVDVKGKRIYSNVQTKIPDYKEDYNSTFIVGEYNGELKIISTVKEEKEEK